MKFSDVVELYLDRAFRDQFVREEVLREQAKHWIREGRLDGYKASEVPDTLKDLVEE